MSNLSNKKREFKTLVEEDYHETMQGFGNLDSLVDAKLKGKKSFQGEDFKERINFEIGVLNMGTCKRVMFLGKMVFGRKYFSGSFWILENGRERNFKVIHLNNTW